MSDSKYPPLYSVSDNKDNKAIHSEDEIISNIEIDPSSLESLLDTENANIDSIALVSNDDVCKILIKEGFETKLELIKALNVFPSPMDAFQYALYTFGQTDMYIVLMINIRQNSIYGYHVLDLTQEYSLADDLINRLKNKDFML